MASSVKSLRWIYGTVGAVLLLFVAGFIAFATTIPAQHDDDTVRADGIVVLTGGASRISDAVTLLAEGRAKRLLITGVHERTTREALNKRLPNHERLFDCCIDIGRSARNTVGNAEEAQDWVRKYSFGSLIVVTSNYHLRRSLAEFARVMPDVDLTPYPVVADWFRDGRWWRNSDAVYLVFREYVKYLAAVTRHTLIDPRAPAGTAAARN